MDTSIGPDANKRKLMLDEVYDYSKEKILIVNQNLDIIYGSSSEDKKNVLNKLLEQWKIHTTTFLEEVVFESHSDKKEIIKDIEALLSEKKTLEKELQMHIPIIDDLNDTVPLIDVKINIDKVLQGYRAIKIERMAELNKLQEEENTICQLLSEEPKFSEIIGLPSATQLDTIKSHLMELKNIQIERQSTFVEQKYQIESLFKDLGENPNLQFDKMVLDDLEKFQLSKSNLDELQKSIKRLEDQTETKKCTAMELRTKLNSLWDRLQIDVTFREHFFSTKNGYSITVINELKREVERCDILKRENMKIFIEKLRVELNDLWDRCYYGERKKKECIVYYDTQFNEHVMDSLETEVDNLKKFYNDNQLIYFLIEEREKLRNKMTSMKENASNPNKLWQNRAGILLKEENERKVILKKLPRVEKELKNLLRVFEEKEGKHFLYYNERLLDIIDNQLSGWKSSKKTTQQTKDHLKSKNHVMLFIRPPKNILRGHNPCTFGNFK